MAASTHFSSPVTAFAAMQASISEWASSGCWSNRARAPSRTYQPLLPIGHEEAVLGLQVDQPARAPAARRSTMSSRSREWPASSRACGILPLS